MFEVPVGATYRVPVKLVDATDRVTEETGITAPTVYYSLNGATKAALASPVWAQISATYNPGVYWLQLTATMTASAGPLVIGVTKTGCAPAALVVDIKPARLTDKTGYSLTASYNAAKTAAQAASLALVKSDTAAILLDTGMDGVVVAAGSKTGYSLTASYDAAKTGAPSAAANATAVRSELTTELGRIDATISSRLAASGYTAPDNASVTAIKAKTDNLPTDPADQSAVEAAITAATSTLATSSALSTLQTTASNILRWFINKRTVTASAQVLYADDETTPLYTQTLNDDGTTVTRGEAT